ncbi:glycosyltransferase [Akkermansiaceae bacterium]|nr:glycosyltransferase [Akkermansiaceae bacterium]
MINFRGTFSLKFNFFSRLAGAKIITFYRENTYQFKPTPTKMLITWFAERLNWSISHQVYTNGSSMPSSYLQEKLDVEKIKRINNFIPIPLIQWQKKERKEISVSHVGRAVEAKNYSTLIKAVSLFCRQYPERDLVLELIGPNLETYIGKIADVANLPFKIRFHGYLKNPSDVLMESDVFIFPSTSEGQPNALLEAAALGIPILASNISSNRRALNKDMGKSLVPVFAARRFSQGLAGIIDKGPDYSIDNLRKFIAKRYCEEQTFGTLTESINRW